MFHHHHRRRRPARPVRTAMIQPLERRQLLSAVATPNVTVVADAVGTTVTGYTPAQIKAAYGLTGVDFGTTAADGAGQTIAIVDAYNAPNIAADLATFDAQFGLATADLTVVSQTGSTTALPATDASWAQEISLDVEWAHAIAPGAKILLVEAASSSTDDLTTAVNYARNAAGVSVVSMSWGTDEFADETTYDTYFTTPAGHAGVTFVAAAGDDGSGGGAEWPSAAAGVVSVGGTTLTLTSSGTYTSESGWTSGGGGASEYEGQATFQYAVQRTGYRTTPDVSWDADPDTGVAVYDSLASDGSSGWMRFGGTSAGAPQWAAVVAIADQGRALAGAAALDGATNTLPTLYGLYAHGSTYTADYHDVTTGSTSSTISAAAKYDQVSGIGTPKGAALIAALVKSTVSVPLKQATVATPTPTPTRPPRPPGHPGVVVDAAAVSVAPTADAVALADAALADAAVTAASAAPVAIATTAAAAWATPATFATGGFDVDPRALAAVADVGPSPAFTVGAGAAPVAPVSWAASIAEAAPVPVAVPLPADFVAPGLPVASPAMAVATAVPASHPVGLAAVAVGAAAVLWAATEPARDRRRQAAAGGEPLTHRCLVAPGLLRG